MDLNKILDYRPKIIKTENGKIRLLNKNNTIKRFSPFTYYGYFSIANILLESTLSDVISIDAKMMDNFFKVKISNEYKFKYVDYKDKYDQVPRQGEILDVIFHMRVADPVLKRPGIFFIIESNELKTISEIRAFIKIESYLYPYLNQLFIHKLKMLGYN